MFNAQKEEKEEENIEEKLEVEEGPMARNLIHLKLFHL